MTALGRRPGFFLLMWLAAACLPGCARPYLPPPDSAISAAAVPLMQAADAAARRSQWQAAIAQYDLARQASPNSHLPLYGLATAYDRLGGRDLLAIAYYRAYLAALPLSPGPEVGLVLGRIDELDRRAADRVYEMVRQARRMADAIPPDIWWDRSVDRQQLLLSLSNIAAKVQAGPPPPDTHRDRRGQPSAFALLEVASWVQTAESIRTNPAIAEPWTELKAEGPKSPENAVRVTCSAAWSQAEALCTLRDIERQWQAKWDIACRP
jgi:hypothetical protein